MKNQLSIPLVIFIAIQCFIAGVMFEYLLRYDEIHQPKINLPEEYKLIDYSDRLIGHFDKDSILHLEFDNSIRFEWEGLEKDIPKDGSHILIEGTDENIVYLNNIDE